MSATKTSSKSETKSAVKSETKAEPKPATGVKASQPDATAQSVPSQPAKPAAANPADNKPVTQATQPSPEVERAEADQRKAAESAPENNVPKEVVEANTNLALTGDLIRGYGMGVSHEAREQLIKSNYALDAETPNIETVTNPEVEKAVEAAEKEAEKQESASK